MTWRKTSLNGTFAIGEISYSAGGLVVAESIKPISQKYEELRAIQEEIKVYIEVDQLIGKSDETMEALYEKFKQSILNLNNHLESEPKKLRIAFRYENKIICDVAVQKNGLKMWINKKRGDLNDPKKIPRVVSNVGHWGNGDYEIVIKDDSQLEYILRLIKGSLWK